MVSNIHTVFIQFIQTDITAAVHNYGVTPLLLINALSELCSLFLKRCNSTFIVAIANLPFYNRNIGNSDNYSLVQSKEDETGSLSIF